MEALRTPDERFEDLPGYAFEPRYLNDLPGFPGLRMHYLDEGPSDAEHVFLCLHGQPTWAYLYRDMIRAFATAGHRAVAPDLFGFGRSDKPVDDGVYTFDFHRQALLAFLDRLDLAGVTLVLHDWGGLLGLTLPIDRPLLFRRLIISNTAFATGDQPLTPGFLAWRDWVASQDEIAVDRLMGRACPQLSEAERAAYAAPFPDRRYQAGVRRFPAMVPDRPDAPGAELSRRARQWWKQEWTGPAFMAIGMQDHILGPPVMAAVRASIHGCGEPLEIADAGHFVPEWGEEIAAGALAAFASWEQ